MTEPAVSNVSLKDCIANSINNLKVNHSKFYESAKNNTKLALNMVQDAIVSIAVVGLMFSAKSLIIATLAGFALYKTIQHGYMEIKKYDDNKVKIKSRK